MVLGSSNKKCLTESEASKKCETAHEVRGTSALRGPERSVDIELSSPGLDSKKAAIPFGITAFSERETGIEPATPSLARRCSTAEPLAHVF